MTSCQEKKKGWGGGCGGKNNLEPEADVICPAFNIKLKVGPDGQLMNDGINSIYGCQTKPVSIAQ